MLPRHARCVLSRLCCNGHSLLLSSYLSRIGRVENPSCSACGHSSQGTSHLILHCPATLSLATLCFSTTSGPGHGELPGSGDAWSSDMPPSLGRGRVINNNASKKALKKTIKSKLETKHPSTQVKLLKTEVIELMIKTNGSQCKLIFIESH